MKDGMFSWFNFYKKNYKIIYKAFGFLIGCKVDQDDMTMHQKVDVFFFSYMPQKGNLEEKKFKFDYIFFFSCFRILFPKKTVYSILITTVFLCYGPLPFFFFFLLEHLFCLSHRKTR
jgi:hypothetical protein